MITQHDIIKAAPKQLLQIHAELQLQQMKMDKEFSIFLDSSDLEDETSPKWDTYKDMLNDYEHVKHLVKTAEYYLGY